MRDSAVPRHLNKPGSPTLAYFNQKCGREYAGSQAPPSWVLDRIADEKRTGGYNTKRSNLCEGCFTYKSDNGACMC